MTIRQVAVLLGLKVRTIREWIRTGRLKAYKGDDNIWRIPEEEVYKQEVQERAIKGRKHSRRVEKGSELGLL